MSSRRSLRATSKSEPSSQQQSTSSSSSTSSGRADSSARRLQKANSPQSSAARRSLSSEEAEGSAKPPSRRTRSQDDAKPEATEPLDDEDDEEGEEEVTRCICGNLEYPGMPILPGPSKSSHKSNGLGDSSNLQEDAGGLFIQCDVCKVWQHGGCVGIMDEAMSPEEFFCEQCRKDLHKITTSATGQRYSRYLPVQDLTSSKSSPAPPTQETKKSKDSRATRGNAEALAGKRRSTMNSRDSAYDEAEQLRRAIEESKKEVGGEGTARRGKRSRSDSEHRKEDTKRQRTISRRSTSPSEGKAAEPNAGSEDEADKGIKTEGNNRIRGAAARNHRAKELREREAQQQRDQERADAAGRRKARSERRRGEDSDPSEEPISHSTSTKEHPPPSPTISKPSHKKTGRPPARRARTGRNQYTKDRDDHPAADTATSPARSNSNGADDTTTHINGTTSHSPNNKIANTNEAGGKSRSKHLNPNRTMNEMKRRIHAMMEFISHTQVELASSHDYTNSQSGNPTPPDSGASSNGKEPEETVATLQKLLGGEGMIADEDIDRFKGLGVVEMMEALTRQLMRWQAEYGK